MRILIAALLGASFSLAGPRLAPGQETADVPRFDVIHLVNGSEFHGRVIREDENRVTILFRGGEIEIERPRIKQIVRGERIDVQEEATKRANLRRFPDRDDFYFVYYRGKRKGWRTTSVKAADRDGVLGYLFSSHTVFLDDAGKTELDLTISEFVDQELAPRFLSSREVGDGYATATDGLIDAGHLKLETSGAVGAQSGEILFSDQTELLMPLQGRLADETYFPEDGQTFKAFDTLAGEFRTVHATRELRKEIVGGTHQYVTVWRLKSNDRIWEVWIDGFGGVVREELFGRAHMVAIRADEEAVAAFARGENRDEEGTADISLEYENIPEGFALVRPNLTWSFEFPDPEEKLAITLLNPTLQASVDVVVLDRVGVDSASETIAFDLLDRLKRRSREQAVLFQKPEVVGGATGLRFEVENERRGIDLRTVGAVSVADGRAYAMLLAAPAWRFHEALPHFEKILRSFSIENAVITGGD